MGLVCGISGNFRKYSPSTQICCGERPNTPIDVFKGSGLPVARRIQALIVYLIKNQEASLPTRKDRHNYIPVFSSESVRTLAMQETVVRMAQAR